MIPTSPPEWRWNIFARELEDILHQHDYELTALERIAGITREEVRRLRRSLKTYKIFPVLNPASLERVIGALTLTIDEVRRLRAAVVVASVQRVLFRRIAPLEALAASDEIYPYMIRILQLPASSSIRNDDDDDDSSAACDSSLDVHLAEAFDVLDRASDDITNSHHSYELGERIHLARMAWYEYHLACDLIHAYTPTLAEKDAWQSWEQGALQGMDLAEKRLIQLGVTLPRQKMGI